MAKLWCGNGEIVVRKRRNGGAIAAVGCVVAVEIHCVTAVAWCVSGVSNPDFTNSTKHSTVLTSILQQINTLYQHFPSAETAKPALEQAKTMLKIALPTFRNDENHTQNSKIHTQNSGYEVRCGECGCGFLHFCCQGGEMVVRLRRLVVWLRLKFIVLRRLRGAFRAFPTLISRISQSIPPFSPQFYSKSTSYINISHLPKPPYRHSNRRKQC